MRGCYGRWVRDCRVLVYSDSPAYGGNEAMMVQGARALLDRPEVRLNLFFAACNERLHAGLAALCAEFRALSLHPLPFASGRWQGLRSRLSPQRIRILRNQFRALAPDRVLVAQGTIEAGTLAILAARRSGLFTISRLPLAFPLTQLRRARCVSAVRDRLNRSYFALPDRFITMSQSMKQLIRSRGARGEIDVVANALDPSRYRRYPTEESRRRLGLPLELYLVGIVGRVHFEQKGHDVFVEALVGLGSERSGLHAVVVGDGVDLDRLRRPVRRRGLEPGVTFVPWQADLSDVYSALDLVVMPSRFEGVPLVMLEALHYGLPLIASDRDAMASVLPAEWLVPPEDSLALGGAIRRVRESSSGTSMRVAPSDLAIFRQQFSTAVLR
jgi:glycosyltransferase involved in cell wall biosynthesis